MLDYEPYPAAVDAQLAAVEEQGAGIGAHIRLAYWQVGFERVGQLCGEWHYALLVALARHLQFTLVQVDVLYIKADKLGKAYACVVEGEEYGAVAHAS